MRFRPYEAGRGVRIAALWARDGADWRLAHGPEGDVLRSGLSQAASISPIPIPAIQTLRRRIWSPPLAPNALERSLYSP